MFAAVLIRTSSPLLPNAPNSLSLRAPPSSSTVSKLIALTAPLPAALLPSTVSVATHCSLPGAIPVAVLELVCSSTKPLVSVNSVFLNVATPRSLWLIPVAFALVPAVFIASLLCAIAAALFTSALTKLSASYWKSNSAPAAVLVIVRLISLEVASEACVISGKGPPTSACNGVDNPTAWALPPFSKIVSLSGSNVPLPTV